MMRHGWALAVPIALMAAACGTDFNGVYKGTESGTRALGDNVLPQRDHDPEP